MNKTGNAKQSNIKLERAFFFRDRWKDESVGASLTDLSRELNSASILDLAEFKPYLVENTGEIAKFDPERML